MDRTKDLIEEIKSKYSTLSKGQKRIFDYIENYLDKAAYMTALEIGKACGVSESTVVRFASELGYDGYPEMRRELKKLLGTRLTTAERVKVADDRISESRVLDDVLKSDAEKIKNTLENIDRNAFDNAIEALLEARRIYVIGMRASSALADFLSYNLGLVFDDVKLVRTTSGSEIFEQLMRIGPKDVLVAISFPRYSTRIVNAVNYADSTGAKVISITDSSMSPIAQNAYSVLTAQSDMASFADSLCAPLSIINAILVAIGKKKKDELSVIFEKLESVWNENHVYK